MIWGLGSWSICGISGSRCKNGENMDIFGISLEVWSFILGIVGVFATIILSLLIHKMTKDREAKNRPDCEIRFLEMKNSQFGRHIVFFISPVTNVSIYDINVSIEPSLQMTGKSLNKKIDYVHPETVEKICRVYFTEAETLIVECNDEEECYSCKKSLLGLTFEVAGRDLKSKRVLFKINETEIKIFTEKMIQKHIKESNKIIPGFLISSDIKR